MTQPDADRTPVAELGYEEARDELADVVAALERGGLGLDASLALWERGEALAQRCTEHLDGARDRIEATLNSDADDED
ncbi:exodeoxyribonuclease VII small subunit [Gordonia phthalatica]|uniref:Exodeoxyribonuclease 7 small subunit n=1 Tax=Gordonia phthalatica TaxID=1136941 RepID=A0A0N9NFR0_9ACTN|nr:exodeoxyribonuclease VII small subunit [Gordonia phthalatica]ALG84148.1 exodeoxyribonuclease VII small subunit [Gordonia phthalatica]